MTNKDKGYIKLYRSLQDKGYYSDPEYVALWVHLLMCASYQQKEYFFNGKIGHLKPGQFITGRDSLSKTLTIHRSKVERILKVFENEHQIEQQTTNKFRIITILNWEEYQVSEQQNEQPVSIQRATNEQQMSTIKKEKKEKNIYTSDFLSFYNSYPKRIGRDAAWKAWQNCNGRRPDLVDLIQAIENQKKSENWTKENGKYIPHPSTWLNQGRWADEVKVEEKRWI